MPFDLEAEIARRLNVSRDAVAPVLDAVIERIRQQVSHFGYARLAGLGTFRGQDGRLSFEPEAGLSDQVNVRFAGLEEITVEAPPLLDTVDDATPEMPFEDTERMHAAPDASDLEDSSLEAGAADVFDAEEERGRPEEEMPDDEGEHPHEEIADEEGERPDEEIPDDDAERLEEAIPGQDAEPLEIDEEDDAEYGESPGDDYERGESGSEEALTPDEEEELREPHQPEHSWRDELDADDSDSAETTGIFWDASLGSGTEIDEDGEPTETTDEAEDADLVEWADEEEDPETWREQSDEEHPLGPVPEQPFEEADFSVVDERQDEDDYEAGEDDFQAEDDEYPADDDEYLADEDEFPAGEDDYLEGEEGYLDDDLVGEEERTPSVEWNVPDVPAVPGAFEGDTEYGDEAEYYGDDAVDEDAEVYAASGAAASGEQGATADDASHDGDDASAYAAAGGAAQHERLRPPSERRHAAARAAGGGAAGGNRSAIWIGVGVLVLVAAAAVIYFSMTSTPSVTTEGPPVAEERDSPAPTDTSAAAGADASAPDETPVDTTVAATAPTPAVQEDPDPLRSPEGINQSDGGYTLIVYSETSESGASNVMEQFRESGFRTSVLQDQEGATTRYRVGVGQFATLDEAVEARDGLAGNELPDDAWVRRIQ